MQYVPNFQHTLKKKKSILENNPVKDIGYAINTTVIHTHYTSSLKYWFSICTDLKTFNLYCISENESDRIHFCLPVR